MIFLPLPDTAAHATMVFRVTQTSDPSQPVQVEAIKSSTEVILREDVKDWLDEHVTSYETRIGKLTGEDGEGFMIGFASDRDAVLYKLRWL